MEGKDVVKVITTIASIGAVVMSAISMWIKNNNTQQVSANNCNDFNMNNQCQYDGNVRFVYTIPNRHVHYYYGHPQNNVVHVEPMPIVCNVNNNDQELTWCNDSRRNVPNNNYCYNTPMIPRYFNIYNPWACIVPGNNMYQMYPYGYSDVMYPDYVQNDWNGFYNHNHYGYNNYTEPTFGDNVYNYNNTSTSINHSQYYDNIGFVNNNMYDDYNYNNMTYYDQNNNACNWSCMNTSPTPKGMYLQPTPFGIYASKLQQPTTLMNMSDNISKEPRFPSEYEYNLTTKSYPESSVNDERTQIKQVV